MSPLASTRWCPTTEQLMILEEMYKGGIKTPTASQIQQITAHLSVFGKIEGKNVFYWFQNHKARDRQKLRRKLISKKQQQQQQQSHHVLHQFEASGSNTTAGLHQFHPYSNSSSFLPHQEGLKEATIPQGMMNYKRKMDNSQQIEEEKWVWLRGQDNWMNTTNAATTTTTINSTDPLHSSCCTRPLITLELFPIKSTSLKDENFTAPNA